LAAASEAMARGHQERLAPLTAEVMTAAGLRFDQLGRVGVTVGPGSFTGLRVGLAFAKGLAAALDIPAIGVGSLEALAAPHAGLVFAAIDARRDQLYLQAFEDGASLMAPDVLPLGLAAARVAEIAGGRAFDLVGSGAALLAGLGGRDLAQSAIDPVQVARLAAERPPLPPRPLYLRAPDARLPAA
ncbi:tRNA (adenosine(37)-N6)-threonylcarbamoyltransferase complex dimerization subunit type 1 TsaB, partial [Phenylobacterium sp.]|uniref:tRNA (adenosine(37)-N6)-threonylcarbamoyltransferase complex dimerization subunit type 1 TsaB n=1 Tax=Phenylobacterium sp. TaxID=1871053 RepID=UPI002735447C